MTHSDNENPLKQGVINLLITFSFIVSLFSIFADAYSHKAFWTSKSGAWFICVGAYIGYKIVLIKLSKGGEVEVLADLTDEDVQKYISLTQRAVGLIILGTLISSYGDVLLEQII